VKGWIPNAYLCGGIRQERREKVCLLRKEGSVKYTSCYLRYNFVIGRMMHNEVLQFQTEA